MAQDITVMHTDSAVTVPADRTNPEFKGGQKALTIFLTKNLRYPDTAADYGVEGSVVMTFVVGVDGSLSNISAHDCKIERFNTTKFSQETVTGNRKPSKGIEKTVCPIVCKRGCPRHSQDAEMDSRNTQRKSCARKIRPAH